MKSGDRCWGAAIPFFALGVLSNTKLDIPDSSANNNARQVVAVTFLGDAPKEGKELAIWLNSQEQLFACDVANNFCGSIPRIFASLMAISTSSSAQY